ncbi:hypothetical protein Acr_07g0004670 [Actinidia rufa]|uniref:Uncharacterized protein n=1 Tax=Actinidia rufa TaxID=165716 RepID=A0A7J0EV68_9ERIC|nr:hypothetical protein Acr_07g0004670 [Actinidia rufa]
MDVATAEQWVNNKTKSTEEEPTVVELEGRPARLGLGATVPRQSKVGPLNDPVQRKLYAKLQVEKKKAAKNKENSKSSAIERHDVKDDEDEDESRTNLFSKKRLVPLTSSLQAKKKK